MLDQSGSPTVSLRPCLPQKKALSAGVPMRNRRLIDGRNHSRCQQTVPMIACGHCRRLPWRWRGETPASWPCCHRNPCWSHQAAIPRCCIETGCLSIVAWEVCHDRQVGPSPARRWPMAATAAIIASQRQEWRWAGWKTSPTPRLGACSGDFHSLHKRQRSAMPSAATGYPQSANSG